jgi:hypothetical protein
MGIELIRPAGHYSFFISPTRVAIRNSMILLSLNSNPCPFTSIAQWSRTYFTAPSIPSIPASRTRDTRSPLQYARFSTYSRLTGPLALSSTLLFRPSLPTHNPLITPKANRFFSGCGPVFHPAYADSEFPDPGYWRTLLHLPINHHGLSAHAATATHHKSTTNQHNAQGPPRWQPATDDNICPENRAPN